MNGAKNTDHEGEGFRSRPKARMRYPGVMKDEVMLFRLGTPFTVAKPGASCVLKLAKAESEPLSLIGDPTLVANSMRSSVFSKTPSSG